MAGSHVVYRNAVKKTRRKCVRQLNAQLRDRLAEQRECPRLEEEIACGEVTLFDNWSRSTAVGKHANLSKGKVRKRNETRKPARTRRANKVSIIAHII